MSTQLVVVTAGLSQPSASRLLADRLAAASESALQQAGETVTVTVLELRELARDLTNLTLTGFGSPPLRTALQQVADADGLIAVTPIFNSSYSGLFKMFVDAVDPSALEQLPVLLGATGGTARHSLALEFAIRPLFAYLRANVMPTAVFAAAEDWASKGQLAERVATAAAELTTALARRPEPKADPYAEPVPFARLLGH